MRILCRGKGSGDRLTLSPVQAAGLGHSGGGLGGCGDTPNRSLEWKTQKDGVVCVLNQRISPPAFTCHVSTCAGRPVPALGPVVLRSQGPG